jgi:hypothetical protein
MRKVPIKSTPSKRKRDFDAVYASILPSILARGCEFKVYATNAEDIFIVPEPDFQCSGRIRGHHAKGRNLKTPWESNAPENLRCLCDHHHTYVHAHPRWARQVGLMISRIGV